MEDHQYSITDVPPAKLMGIAVLSAVLFFLSLIPLEAIPEIPVDIDQKAFFIPLMLAALLPVGKPTWAVALGAALGECMRDMIEGYEPDDPIGFIGYVIGFAAAGYLIGTKPRNWLRLTAATLLAATVQAAFEASSFLLLAEESVEVALVSWIGNSITHGVLGGILPLLFLVPALHGRIERYMGFAPKAAGPAGGQPRVLGRQNERQAVEQKTLPPNAAVRDGRTDRSGATIVSASNVTFCYPGANWKALTGVSFQLQKGEILGVMGPVGAGKTTLCLALAGFAPRITGGELSGEVWVGGLNPRQARSEEMARRVGVVFEDYAAQLTQVKVLEEVMGPLLNREIPLREAEERARELLTRVKLGGKGMESKRTWELSGGQQLRLAIAATLAMDPEVLILDSVTRLLDPYGRENLRHILDDLAGKTTLVLVEDDTDVLGEIANQILVMVEGKVAAFGPPQQVLRNSDLLTQAGLEPPLSLRVAQALKMAESPLEWDEFTRAIGPVKTAPRTEPRPDGTAQFGKILVRVEHATFCYEASGAAGDSEEIRALEDINLEIHEGEVHAIIGADGSGKTTLARLMAGLSRPRQGQVRVDGVDTHNKKISELAQHVGITFQNPDEQLSERTVDEEIGFPLAQRRRQKNGRASKPERYDEEFIREQVGRACESLEIDEELQRRDPSLLPRGLRKIVVMAEALVLGPAVLILDEPSSGLDVLLRRKLKHLMRRLREQDKGVLLIDHDIDFVCEVADTVTVLDKGKVVLQGPVRAVFAETGAAALADLHIPPPRAARLARRLGINALTYNDLLEQLSDIRDKEVA